MSCIQRHFINCFRGDGGGGGGGQKALKNILSSMLHCVCVRGYIFLIL